MYNRSVMEKMLWKLKYKYRYISASKMGLSMYEKMAERTKITLNYVIKENPIKG